MPLLSQNLVWWNDNRIQIFHSLFYIDLNLELKSKALIVSDRILVNRR